MIKFTKKGLVIRRLVRLVSLEEKMLNQSVLLIMALILPSKLVVLGLVLILSFWIWRKER